MEVQWMTCLGCTLLLGMCIEKQIVGVSAIAKCMHLELWYDWFANIHSYVYIRASVRVYAHEYTKYCARMQRSVQRAQHFENIHTTTIATHIHNI